MSEADPQFLKVVTRQKWQYPEIDIVLAEGIRVLIQTQIVQPPVDLKVHVLQHAGLENADQGSEPP